jgi:hypothetical protein
LGIQRDRGRASPVIGKGALRLASRRMTSSRFAWRRAKVSGTQTYRGQRPTKLRHRRFSPGRVRSSSSSTWLVSETFFQRGRGSSRGNRVPRPAPEARRAFFHLPEVVSTMWTESRYPNTDALMARPRPASFVKLSAAPADLFARGEVFLLSRARAKRATDLRGAYVRSPDRASAASTFQVRLALTSGGKVTPAYGQEHPRTEL